MIKKLTIGIVAFSLVFLIQRAQVRADWVMMQNGDLVFSSKQVLGEENQNTAVSTSGEHENIQRGESEQRMIPGSPSIPNPTPIKHDDIEHVNILPSNTGKTEVDIQDTKGHEIKQEQNNFEIQNGDETTKISTGEANKELKITTNNVNASTEFPLSVNPTTKALTVTTSAGAKTVAILPDKAAQIISSLNIMDNPQTQAKLQVSTEDGQLVYRAVGQKELKLFGLIPVTIPTQAVVSAENGQVVQTNNTFLLRLLNFFSRS